MATQDHTTSRRSVLAGLAALPVAAAPALAAGNPDARLIALASEWRELVARLDGEPDDDQADAITSRIYAIQAEAMTLPVHTIEGLRAFASITRRGAEMVTADGYPDELLLMSLVDKVEAFAGARPLV